MKAIVLAGGQGTRLHPYTDILPKPLIPLGDMPILHVILLQLYNSGFSDITLSVRHKAQLIEEYFGDGSWLGPEIKYSQESKALGTAGPLRLISTFDQPALVMNADLLTTVDFRDVFVSHQCSGAEATIVLCRYDLNLDFGVVDIDAQQQVVDYTEKPSFNFLVSGGIYVLEPSVLEYLSLGEYMDMPALFQVMLANKRPVNAYLFEGDWFDVGTAKQLRYAREAFRLYRARYLNDNGTGSGQPDKTQKLDAVTRLGG